MPPFARPLGNAFARHQKAAREVVAHHGVPALGADGGQRRRVLATGVVDEAVDAAMAFEHPSDGGAHGVFLADVAGVRGAHTTRSFDFNANDFELLGFAADDGHSRPERRQLVRRAAPDARAAAGDDHHLAGKQARLKHRSIRRHSHLELVANQALAW